MIRTVTNICASAIFLVLLSSIASATVMVEPWVKATTETNEKPALVEAVIAKVWGNVCSGFLTEADIAEAQEFIDRFVAVFDGSDSSDFYHLLSNGLERTYIDAYSTLGRCATVTDARVAYVMTRIRAALADPMFWIILAVDVHYRSYQEGEGFSVEVP